MLRYLSRYRRQSLDPKTTMDTYIEAYKLTHESYQNQQEADTAKITEENERILKRTKRLAAADPDPPHEKDFIKFELTDAIQPDDETLKHRVVNKGRNFRMPYEIADTLVVFGNKTDGIDIVKPLNVTRSDDDSIDDSKTKQTRRRRRKSRKESGNSKPKREIFDDDSQEEVSDDDDDDMSIGESRKIKIIAPAGKTRNGEIPIGVQKIIEMVLQDRARAAKARISKGQKAYGDKFNNNQGKDSQQQRQKNVVRDIHNSNNNNNEWRPVPQVSLGRYPVVHGQMENAPDYLTFVPVKSYKTVSYGKPVSEIKQQQPAPVTNIVPVPQIQYIIKEVPIPVTSSLEASQLKPSFKITYDTSLLDSKFKESSIDSGYDSQTKAPSLDTSESYVKIVTPTTATKTVIDHSKKPEYKSPTPSYEKLSSYENSFYKPSSSPAAAPSFEKLSSYDNSPFKPSRPAYVAPTLLPTYESHFESHKLDALTSLLNKDPADQLKGFHDLLQEEKTKQGDTAPILFHPNGIKLPKPKIKLNIKVLDDVQQQQKPEPITIEEFNRLYGGENGVDLPGYSPPKEFTPIKEESPVDNFESYKTSFKSITEPAKSQYKSTKVQYKPIIHHTPISEIKGPVIQHHDHSVHTNSGDGGISKGYEDEKKVSIICFSLLNLYHPIRILASFSIQET